MSFIKNTLKNTASLLLAVTIIWSAYAAISSVNSWDTLTATSWNEIVTTLTNTDTNSTDLTTKSYVDSVVSAAGWGSFNNCETKYWTSNQNVNLTCSAWKSIRSHSYMCSHWTASNWNCSISSITTNTLVWEWYYEAYNGTTNDSVISASIICCDD